MRGVFTAAYLAKLEEILDVRVADSVDLIAGTSTGGIIALGLADRRPAREMLDLYVEHGKRIFGRPRRVRRLTGPLYDRKHLDALLYQRFGDKVLNELDRPVCVAAHELVSGVTRVFKTDHASGLVAGQRWPVWKVAAATAAAPTYFAPVQLADQDSHIDGGVWANNPAMMAITEAVAYFDVGLEQVRMLSVGTASSAFRVASHDVARRMGLIGWLSQGRELLLGGGVVHASDRQARLLLGESRYVRIDDRRSDAIRMDDWRRALPLRELGEQQARLTSGRVAELLGIR
jgi:uncharacterized protein